MRHTNWWQWLLLIVRDGIKPISSFCFKISALGVDKTPLTHTHTLLFHPLGVLFSLRTTPLKLQWSLNVKAEIWIFPSWAPGSRNSVDPVHYIQIINSRSRCGCVECSCSVVLCRSWRDQERQSCVAFTWLMKKTFFFCPWDVGDVNGVYRRQQTEIKKNKKKTKGGIFGFVDSR